MYARACDSAPTWTRSTRTIRLEKPWTWKWDLTMSNSGLPSTTGTKQELGRESSQKSGLSMAYNRWVASAMS